jgi:hypothetical protein
MTEGRGQTTDNRRQMADNSKKITENQRAEDKGNGEWGMRNAE